MWVPQRIEVSVNIITQEIKFKRQKPISVSDIACSEGAIGKVLKELLKKFPNLFGCQIVIKANKNN